MVSECSMSQSQPQNVSSLQDQVSYWQKLSQLELGRIDVLKMVACSAPLAATLQKLCVEAQVYNPEMLCSILRYDEETKTLHSIASVSIPDFYNDAISGVTVGLGVGSCGTSAFTKERVVVEDINTHPYWVQFKDLALSAGMQACWSEPIIGPNGRVYGTFAMYYREPKKPSGDDLQYIEVCANLAAVVYENHENKQKLLVANRRLAQTLDERNSELETTIHNLEAAMSEQGKRYLTELQSEKLNTTRSLVVGMAKEISHPLGIAVTAGSTATNGITEVINAIESEPRLSKQKLINQLKDVLTAVSMNYDNLMEATSLLDRFKEVDIDGNQNHSVSRFDIADFFSDFEQAVKERIGGHHLALHSESVTVKLSRAALWQIMLELVQNAVEHGFSNEKSGLITIDVARVNHELIIDVKDNGVGVSDVFAPKIFEPFYVACKKRHSLGLGLSVVQNLVKHVLMGKITHINTPIGIRFEITLPLGEDN